MTQPTSAPGPNPSARLGDFAPQAQAYAAARPTYPLALVERLLARAGVRPGAAVLDAGAGTGIFTALLSGRGLQITALEPGDEMRAQSAPLPDVTWIKGTFEETSLPDHSQHWVVSAQAFHWADPQRALPELRRVLKPGRALTVLWNNRRNEGHEILAWTQAAIRRHVPEFEENYRQRDWEAGARDRDWAAILTSTGDFVDATQDEERHDVPMSRQRYLDLWKSHNRLTTTAGPKRFAQLLADLEQYLTRRNVTQIVVPYCCRAWTVRRKAPTA